MEDSVYTGIVCVLCFLVIIVLIVCLGVGYAKWKGKMVAAESPETSESFMVQNNKQEPDWVRKEVARRLSRLARKGDALAQYAKQHSYPNAYAAERLYTRWKRLRANPSGLRETGFGERSAAYTVSKGEELRICVRDEQSDKLFEDENDATMVFLHELGHLMSKSYGHNLEFQQNFAAISKLAVKLGLYHYVDYNRNPTTYCGVDITHPAY